jgi:hypothetical protein
MRRLAVCSHCYAPWRHHTVRPVRTLVREMRAQQCAAADHSHPTCRPPDEASRLREDAVHYIATPSLCGLGKASCIAFKYLQHVR